MSPATRISASRQAGWFRTKSGFSSPSGVKRISSNRFAPRPVRRIVFRNCLGMIMSVSTLINGMGAAMPVRVVNLSMRCSGPPRAMRLPD